MEGREKVSTEIITAAITGLITLCGVLIANNRTQAVTETKLEELTREVRQHNGFAQRIPVIEEKLGSMEGRVDSLESLHKRQ